MTDTNSYTINIANKRKSGAVEVTVSQPGKETITKTVNAGVATAVKVYPGTDSLEVVALDCTKGEIITVISENHPEKSETKDKPPYDFKFILDIPEDGDGADATEDNIIVQDDEGDPK